MKEKRHTFIPYIPLNGTAVAVVDHVVEVKIISLPGSGLRRQIFSYKDFAAAKNKINDLISRYKKMEAVFKVHYNGRLVFDSAFAEDNAD